MKIIDLYKLISNKEVDKLPKKIKWRNVIYDLKVDEEFINYNPQSQGEWLLNQFLWKLNEEIEVLEEEKKIPKKIDIQIQNETTGNAYIINEYGTKCYLTKHSKILANKINEIIDYLKSKGE